MAAKRSRPGNPAVRKGKNVGPDYPNERYRNPYNGAGLDYESGSSDTKTMESPSATIEGPGIGLDHNYDKYWEGK